MRNRFSVVVAVTGVLVGSAFLAGCDSNGGTKHVICDYAMDSGTITGRLATLDGSTATFTVEHTTPNPQAVRAPLAPGTTKVVVRYDQGDEQFLTVGRDYKVEVTPTGTAGAAPYVSSIRRDEHSCSGGTTYADGSAIAT